MVEDRRVLNVSLYCEGTTDAPEYGRTGKPHARVQIALFAHTDGDDWTDGRQFWEAIPWVGDTRLQYVTSTDAELDARRGRVLRSSKTDETRVIGQPEADDVRARFVITCPECKRKVPVLRKRLEKMLAGTVAYGTPIERDVWEYRVSLLDDRRH